MNDSTRELAPDSKRPTPNFVAEQRVVLHGVRWDTYKLLMQDIGDSRGCRVAFDDGELEIMAPYFAHGGSTCAINQLIVILVEELGMDCQCTGGLTCERNDLLKAIEPDTSFYIQHAGEIRGLQNICLPDCPPPDLMVEVNIGKTSMNKLGICAALGVPEYWLYDGEKLEIWTLNGSDYLVSNESPTFPGIPLLEELPAFIETSNFGFIEMCREFRKWVRAQLKSKKPARRSKKS